MINIPTISFRFFSPLTPNASPLTVCMSDIVIKAENLGKKYVIGHQAERGGYTALHDVLMQNARTLWSKTKDLVTGKPIIQGDTMEEVWAFADVSFEIRRGETVGIPLFGYVKENRFKLYLFDVGLLGAMSSIAPATFLNYAFGSYQGYVAENFVAQELRAAGDKLLYCRQGRTAEVEFLLEKEGEILPVEVKSGQVTQSKSLKVYAERYHPAKTYILSAKNVKQRNISRYLPLYMAGRLASRNI
jgi:predicted AAA+ superfamily ATPase